MRFFQSVLALTLIPLSLAVALQPRTPTVGTSLETRAGNGWMSCSQNAMQMCHDQGSTCKDDCSCTPPPNKQCSDSRAKSTCDSQGKTTNPDCSCGSCSQWSEWTCKSGKGTYDSKSCGCTYPTVTIARRAALAGRVPICHQRKTACLLSNSIAPTSLTNRNKYECLDLTSSIDSCGGCVTEGKGKDCSSIEGVEDVSCENSTCVVKACEFGWEISEDESECVKVRVEVEGKGRGGRKNNDILIAAVKGAEKFWAL